MRAFKIKPQSFSSFKEWSKYNEQITGVSLKKWKPSTIINRCLLIVFHPYGPNSPRLPKKPWISIHKIKYLHEDRVFYLNNRDIKGNSFYSNMIIIPRKQLTDLKPIIKNYLNYYASVMRKRLEIENAKRKWIREQMEKIRLEAEEKFKIPEMEAPSLDELLKPEEEGNFSYFCKECNQYYFFDAKRKTCPVCKKKLKPTFDKNVDIDILIDPKALDELRE